MTLKSVSYLSNKYSDVKTITYNITNGYGNSKIDFNEDCDDGNRINNDGCSSVGKLEIGFNCCQDIGGRDSCQTIENSLPYHFSNSLNNQVVDPKYGSDTDGWSYCSIENNNCYLGYHTYQIRYGYSGNYVIKDFAYCG